MIASLSFAIEKSPRALTTVTFGTDGTTRCSPGGNAWRQILDSFSSVCKRETIRGTLWSGGEVCVSLVCVQDSSTSVDIRRSSPTACKPEKARASTLDPEKLPDISHHRMSRSTESLSIRNTLGGKTGYKHLFDSFILRTLWKDCLLKM